MTRIASGCSRTRNSRLCSLRLVSVSFSQFEDDVLLYVSYVERKLDRRALAVAVEYAEVITDNQACCIALLLYPHEMTIKMTINSLHVFRRPDVTHTAFLLLASLAVRARLCMPICHSSWSTTFICRARILVARSRAQRLSPCWGNTRPSAYPSRMLFQPLMRFEA